jgi:hypothetical protein
MRWTTRDLTTKPVFLDRLGTQARWKSTLKDDTGASELKETPRRRGRPKKSAEEEIVGAVKIKAKRGKSQQATAHGEATSKHTVADDTEVNPKRRLPKKRVEDAGTGTGTVISNVKKRSPRAPAKIKASSTIPARLLAKTNHHDLASFLAHAASKELRTTSTTYKGTHYEYTVASALQSYGFALHRTGRSNDLGVDLVGTFALPKSKRARKNVTAPPIELKVIIQCKATKLKPSMVRELAGAYAGAPAGWRGENVLALLVASGPATKGAREALQRSRSPMALMQMSAEGSAMQFLWNEAAAAVGLEGLGVTARHAAKNAQEGHEIALTWVGEAVGMLQSPLD